MCFVKSSPVEALPQQQDSVVRHEANASLTKNSKNNTQSAFRENIKTSALGLDESAKVSKKTLLGE